MPSFSKNAPLTLKSQVLVDKASKRVVRPNLTGNGQPSGASQHPSESDTYGRYAISGSPPSSAHSAPNQAPAALPLAFSGPRGLRPSHSAFPEPLPAPQQSEFVALNEITDQQAPVLNELGTYNQALQTVRDELNTTMTPVQRHLARTLTIVASLAAVGGGVAAGVLAVGALGAAASVVGLPVAAVAAMVGAAVLVGGGAIAFIAGAITRAVVRESLHKNKPLETKLDAVRQLRDQLQSRKKLNPGEKALLRNANKVLAKVDGFGSHLKSQLKLALKTEGIAVIGSIALVPICIGGPLALLGGGSGGSLPTIEQLRKAFFSGGPLKGRSWLEVNVDGGQALLEVMENAQGGQSPSH